MLKVCEDTDPKETNTTLFSKNHIKSEKIIEHIRNNDFTQIFEGLAYVKHNGIVIDYKYFKYFATINTYDIITNYIDKCILHILTTYNTFTVYVNMKSIYC